jgi:5'-deoxynucleotidase YfbR-like HD superfamily hydrolase
MKQLEEKVRIFLFSFEAWDFIKDDMKNIFSDNTKTLEDEIINSAKKFAWYQECVINSRVFLYAYDVAMEQIKDYLEEHKNNLYSLRELLKNDNYKNYLSHIRRLSHSMRWSWKQRKYPISVMSHLTIVTFISYIMWSLENQNWKDYDIYNLMIKWAYHDIPEAITWDIITPIKNAVEWFRDVLETVEENMMNDYFFIYVWDDYKQEIKKCMLDPFSWTNGELVKQADIISALLEAKIERDSGNMEFWEIYRNVKRIVNKFDSYSSNYFLKDVLLSFWEDLGDINLEKLWK